MLRSEFVTEQINRRPIEARLLRKTWKALSHSYSPITSLDDGEERCEVTSEADLLTLAFNLDEFTLYTEGYSWVRVVMGESPEDMLADYTIDLDEALKPVYAWAEKRS